MTPIEADPDDCAYCAAWPPVNPVGRRSAATGSGGNGARAVRTSASTDRSVRLPSRAIVGDSVEACIMWKLRLKQLQALRSLPIVIVNDAAQYIPTPNGLAPTTLLVPCRDLLSDALMRPRLVEIPDVFLEYSMQMPLTQDQHMVETLFPH